ncbi:MAG: zinc-ribbon and DUF3426 domain-containing protein [Xanthomonadales bacterium]|nr:zinc-ribbon and DUF3426 domain-containing protein [Xanthomonadales bacterium]
MYTQCSHCLTVYRIALDDLSGGRGEVVCGSCDQPFDALATLRPSPPPEPLVRLDVRPPVLPRPRLIDAVMRPAALQPTLFPAPSAAAAGNPPGFLRRPQRTPGARTGRAAWWSGTALLALVLFAQILYAERDRLLAIPTYRAWADSVCLALGCTLPGSDRAIDGLALVSRDIRRHPAVEGALLISATLANRADRGRPYPVLELTLSDLDGRVLAMRRFRPVDYLSDPRRADAGMPAATTLPLEFEVVDPGPSAVAFEFRFLPPDA